MQRDAVASAHRGERTDAASEAKRQDGDLANLALLVRHLFGRTVVNAGCFTLVYVATIAEHLQHGVGLRVARQPWRCSSFYRCPVGHDENVTSGGDKSGSQHSFKNICNPSSVGWNDTVTSDH